MKRNIALFIILIAITVFAAPDSIRLEYSFEDNPYQAFQMTTQSKSEFSMFGIDQAASSELILNIHREVEKTDRRGLYKVKNVIDSGRIIIDGKESRYDGEGNSTEVLMNRTGKIIENLSESGKKINELQVNFPDKEITVGSYWGSTAKFDISDITEETKNLDVAIKFVLKGFEEYDGYKCAVIESRFETNEVKDRLLKIDIKGNGKIYFAYEEGKLLANFNQLKINVDVKSDQNKEHKLRTIFKVDLELMTKLKSL